MSIHPVLVEKLNAALEPSAALPGTLRDARLPAVPGKVHAVIGMRRAGKTTVHALLGHLLDAFLLSTVSLATESERKRNSNPRKIYPADPGLIPAFDASGRSNLGHALETAVLNEIERRRAGVGYVKTDRGLEVDFLVRRPGGAPELIQVCADAGNPETAGREMGALHEAGEQYPLAKQRLLTLTRDGAPAGTAVDVIVQPAYEWMLAEPDND